MGLSGKTILVAMSELEWLVRGELEDAGAQVVETDSRAGAEQILEGSKMRIHALVLGPHLEDGYAGSLIEKARSGLHRCETILCVTDPKSESSFVLRALAEAPAGLIELHRQVKRLVPMVHAAVQHRSVRRRRGSRRAEADRALPLDLLQAIFGTGDGLLRWAKEMIRTCGLFTPTEAEILCMYVEGHDVEEIARRLDKTVRTMRFHMTNIRKKIELHGPAALLRLLAAELDRRRTDTAENE